MEKFLYAGYLLTIVLLQRRVEDIYRSPMTYFTKVGRGSRYSDCRFDRNRARISISFISALGESARVSDSTCRSTDIEMTWARNFVGATVPTYTYLSGFEL